MKARNPLVLFLVALPAISAAAFWLLYLAGSGWMGGGIQFTYVMIILIASYGMSAGFGICYAATDPARNGREIFYVGAQVLYLHIWLLNGTIAVGLEGGLSIGMVLDAILEASSWPFYVANLVAIVGMSVVFHSKGEFIFNTRRGWSLAVTFGCGMMVANGYLALNNLLAVFGFLFWGFIVARLLLKISASSLKT